MRQSRQQEFGRILGEKSTQPDSDRRPEVLPISAETHGYLRKIGNNKFAVFVDVRKDSLT